MVTKIGPLLKIYKGTQFWTQKWCQIWHQKLVPRNWNFGPKCTKTGTKNGFQNWNQKWSQIWNQKLDPKIDPKSGPKNWSQKSTPKLDSKFGQQASQAASRTDSQRASQPDNTDSQQDRQPASQPSNQRASQRTSQPASQPDQPDQQPAVLSHLHRQRHQAADRKLLADQVNLQNRFQEPKNLLKEQLTEPTPSRVDFERQGTSTLAITGDVVWYFILSYLKICWWSARQCR